MSDGNFHRSLLPSGGYASGVRAGESRMRKRAIEAFREWMDQKLPTLPEDERLKALEHFAQALK